MSTEKKFTVLLFALGGQQPTGPETMGWTGEPAFQRMEYEHVIQENTPRTPKLKMLTYDGDGDYRNELHPQEEVLTGGIELVPLLARRRAGYRRNILTSTDVTRVTNGPSVPKPVWRPPVNEQEYLRELSSQIVNKEMKIKEIRSDDILKSQRHFDTWAGFWGRPGHGAPKETTVKENLDYLLYRMPVATM